MRIWTNLIAATLSSLFLASSTCYGATIYACKKKVGGNVRIVTETKKCQKNEIKISWSDWADFTALQTQDTALDSEITALQTRATTQDSEITALQTLAAALAPASHQHDDRYYTEDEIGGFFTAPRARRIDVPVGSLTTGSGGIIVSNDFGYSWLNDWHQAASLNLQQPVDWDKTSPVTVRLFFLRAMDAAGEVKFFLRPRCFNVGEPFVDASSILRTAPSVSGAVFQALDITIPAANLQKDWWNLSIQRDTGTYSNAVTLFGVSVYYTGEGL
jgi:hypothetical protein